MATIHPVGTGHPGLAGPGRGGATTRSMREGSAAGMLVVIGGVVAVVGVVVHVWAVDAGQLIAVLVLLPAAVLQAVIGLIDGVRDHDPEGESRSAAFGLLGIVAVVACIGVAVAVGL
jgi:hypothetical protein